MRRKITVREGGRPTKISGIQALARAIYRDAMNGDWRARQQLIDLMASLPPTTTQPTSSFEWTEEDEEIERYLDGDAESEAQRQDREAATRQPTSKEKGDRAARGDDFGPEF
jgi:hypothetical protein